MNWDQIYSLIRNVLLGLGGILVTKGYLSADTLSLIVGGIVASVSVFLSQVFHLGTGQSLVASPAPVVAAPIVVAPAVVAVTPTTPKPA